MAGYTVVYASDHSIPAKARKGGLWYILSDVESVEDRVVTMVQAAKDLHLEMLEPTHAFVWLFSDEKAAEQGLRNIGTASYVPDAEGRLSGFPTDGTWHVNVSDFVASDLQNQIRSLWIENRANHLGADDILNEESLRAELSEKLNIRVLIGTRSLLGHGALCTVRPLCRPDRFGPPQGTGAGYVGRVEPACGACSPDLHPHGVRPAGPVAGTNHIVGGYTTGHAPIGLDLRTMA